MINKQNKMINNKKKVKKMNKEKKNIVYMKMIKII